MEQNTSSPWYWIISIIIFLGAVSLVVFFMTSKRDTLRQIDDSNMSSNTSQEDTLDQTISIGAPSTQENPDSIIGRASIEAIDIRIQESFPVTVILQIKGNLADGCTELGEITINRSGTAFTVTVPTVRPREAMCTQALVSFEKNITLPTKNLASGTYTVSVGQLQKQFTLTQNNSLDFQAGDK